MDQACLSGLQVTQRCLRRVPRQANCFLGALAFRDVSIDHYAAAVRYRVAAHFDDAAIGPRPLVAHLPAGILEATAQLYLEIGRTELATLGEIAEKLRKGWTGGKSGVRQ